jgi:hypothetical protein
LKLLFLLTGPEFLCNLGGLWVLLPQTGAPLLLTVRLLVRGNLLFRESYLLGVCRE